VATDSFPLNRNNAINPTRFGRAFLTLKAVALCIPRLRAVLCGGTDEKAHEHRCCDRAVGDRRRGQCGRPPARRRLLLFAGIAGGLTGGYQWQNQQFVFGGETDIQISGADDTKAPFKFANPWFGTLRGRAGYAMNNILFYATLGLAYGNVRADNLALSESKTTVGWTVGGGVEVGLTPNWTAKAEYLYADFNSRSYSVTGTSNALDFGMLRFGVNYHF
jgi:hypothetical protein